jgi:hypothetical protein
MQELHQGGLLTPGLLRSLAILDGTGRQCTSLGLKIDLGVDVSSVKRDMSEPPSDSVDIDAGAKQVGGRRVPDNVRADSFGRNRWHFVRCPCGVAFDQSINPRARERLLVAVEKDPIRRRTSCNSAGLGRSAISDRPMRPNRDSDIRSHSYHIPAAAALPRMHAHGAKDFDSAGDRQTDLMPTAKTGHSSRGHLS